MNKKYILIDLDGTIIDSKVGITKSVQYALNSFGIQVDNIDDLVKFIGPPLKESFRIHCGFNDVEVEKAVVKYREYFTDKGIYENVLYKGIDTLLHTLQQDGKILAVATSKATIYAEKIVKNLNIHEYFSFVSGSEWDGSRSAKDLVIQYALDNLSITEKEDVIMIGDKEHDILGAKKVGVDNIGILHGYGDYTELSSAGADYIVKDIGELSELLLGNG